MNADTQKSVCHLSFWQTWTPFMSCVLKSVTISGPSIFKVAELKMKRDWQSSQGWWWWQESPWQGRQNIRADEAGCGGAEGLRLGKRTEAVTMWRSLAGLAGEVRWWSNLRELFKCKKKKKNRTKWIKTSRKTCSFYHLARKKQRVTEMLS